MQRLGASLAAGGLVENRAAWGVVPMTRSDQRHQGRAGQGNPDGIVTTCLIETSRAGPERRFRQSRPLAWDRARSDAPTPNFLISTSARPVRKGTSRLINRKE